MSKISLIKNKKKCGRRGSGARREIHINKPVKKISWMIGKNKNILFAFSIFTFSIF